VPGPYEYEFGYNRGNAQHNRNHYEQSKDSRFRTKVCYINLIPFSLSFIE
jgi:hypothetical protein